MVVLCKRQFSKLEGTDRFCLNCQNHKYKVKDEKVSYWKYEYTHGSSGCKHHWVDNQMQHEYHVKKDVSPEALAIYDNQNICICSKCRQQINDCHWCNEPINVKSQNIICWDGKHYCQDCYYSEQDKHEQNPEYDMFSKEDADPETPAPYNQTIEDG